MNATSAQGSTALTLHATTCADMQPYANVDMPLYTIAYADMRHSDTACYCVIVVIV